MRKSVGMLLLAFWACSLCRVPVAAAVEAVPLPPQVPAHTASGATNLTDVWLHSGGGRLYWNTLVTPRQIALEGARFVDPAAVPELSMQQNVFRAAIEEPEVMLGPGQERELTVSYWVGPKERAKLAAVSDQLAKSIDLGMFHGACRAL